MMIIRAALAVALVLGLVAAPFAAEAQQVAKVPRIGFLAGSLAGAPHMPEAFHQGLRDLGFLWQPGVVGERTEKDTLKGAEVAARALGVRLQFVEARGPADKADQVIE